MCVLPPPPPPPPQSSHPLKVDPQLESQLAETRQELAAVREMNQQLQDQLSGREVESIKVRGVAPRVTRVWYSTVYVCVLECVHLVLV